MQKTTTYGLGNALRRAVRAVTCTPVCMVLAYLLMEFSLNGCQIEPPLRLAEDTPEGNVGIGEVITDLDIIWDLNTDWKTQWWYGWDENDINLSGELEYPDPTSFEARFYYYGEDNCADYWLRRDKHTAYERSFRRRFDFGYHNMLIWSNIDSPDGIQSLIVDETDPDSVRATTSRSRLTYALPSRNDNVRNNPEIFYSAWKESIYISRDTLDYVYFDRDRNAWVKNIKADLYPLVYIYLVQIAVYNNHGRITGMTDYAAMSQMADGVHMHTGHTSNNPVSVVYPMRLKNDLPARDGRHADIFGGKLTTFGLCDMESWARSRAPRYAGSRTDLCNHVMVGLSFTGGTDSAYRFDVTEQLRRQVHGGIVTLEIDADTLDMPHSRQGAGVFDPTVELPDSINHEFIM